MRITLAALFLASTLIACTDGATPAADELGEETEADGEEGKGDGASAFTYFTLAADNRACSFNAGPDCGRGFWVARANRSTTQCGRGVADSRCKLFEIDWSGSAMPRSVTEGYEQGLEDGQPLLVRGSIVPAADDAGSTLHVTEIWVPNSPIAVAGVYTLVKDNGIRCVRAPCPHYTERRLNSNVSPANIAELDFDAAEAEPEVIDAAREHLYAPSGLIVVGYREVASNGGKVRTANKFFTRAPVPLR